MKRRMVPILACVAALVASPVRGEDHFLTIGGGYSPTGNQISLENNVRYFQSLLGALRLDGLPHEIFFSDGDNPQRDVEYCDLSTPPPRANVLLAQVFGKEDGLQNSFRTHQVPGVRGATTPENLDRWFQEVGSRLTSGDRLIVYLTGHGGKGGNPQDPHFYLWNHKKVDVKEFVGKLDKLPPEVQVVLVMVQCYSGGFANVIFRDGDPKAAPTAANRCGFFATVHDRPAAGCTPDINEADYKEYSSSFWSALYGKDRVGREVAPPDYDGNGQISFAEAHAYTVVSSDTIDIPVKTSDALLRAISSTKKAGMQGLLTADSPYDALVATASPTDKAMLDGLSRQLGLTGAQRAKAARELASKTEKERRDVNSARRKTGQKFNSARQQIAETLKTRWPEMENPWHPQVMESLRNENSEIVDAIEGHASYSAFQQAHDEMQTHGEKSLDLERRWAKCQRFLRVAENVALAANLEKIGTPEQKERYQKLLTSESGTLQAQ